MILSVACGYISPSVNSTRSGPLEALRERLNKSDKEQWGWNIVEFYLGDISEKELMTRLKADATDNTSLAEHLSETNFYLGKYYL